MGKLSKKSPRTIGHHGGQKPKEKQTSLMSFFGKTPPAQKPSPSLFTMRGDSAAKPSATTPSMLTTPSSGKTANYATPATPATPVTDTEDIIPPTPESEKVRKRPQGRIFLNSNPIPFQDNRPIVKAKKKLKTKKGPNDDRPVANYSVNGANEKVEQLSELQMKCLLASSGMLPVAPMCSETSKEVKSSGEKREAKKGLTPDAKRRLVEKKKMLASVPRRKLEMNNGTQEARDFEDSPEPETPTFSITKLHENILTNDKSKADGKSKLSDFSKPTMSRKSTDGSIDDIMDELKSVKNIIDKKEKSVKKETKSSKIPNSQSSVTSSSSGGFDDDLLNDIMQEIRGTTHGVKQHNYDKKLDNKYKSKTTPKRKTPQGKTSRAEQPSSPILVTDDGANQNSCDEVDFMDLDLETGKSEMADGVSTNNAVKTTPDSRLVLEMASPKFTKTPKSKMADKMTPKSKMADPRTPISKMADDQDVSGFGLDESWMEHVDLENVEAQVNGGLCKDLSDMSPFKEKKSPSFPVTMETALCQQYNRHVVKAVTREGIEVRLTLKPVPGSVERECILRDSWTDVIIREGDVINVLGPRLETDGTWVVDEIDGTVVVNPDFLVSGTTVVSSLFCMRKSVLNAKFKGSDRKNVHMLYGSIIHCIFQKVLQDKCSDTGSVQRIADQFIKDRKFLGDMYELQISEKTLREEISKYIPFIVKWTQKYVRRNSGYTFGEKVEKADSEISVLAVKDIEENVWCPRFGIKGKIDVTVEVELKSERKKKVMPLELKTGKTSFSVEHKGQVMLYSMMLADRRVDPECGLLLYLRDASMQRVSAKLNDRRGLIQLRNELTNHLANPLDHVDGAHVMTSLPEPINNARMCSKCPQLVNCALYQRHVDSAPLRAGHAMESLVPGALAHLTDAHWAFFKRWCTMVELESRAAARKDMKRNIWCQGPHEREKSGSGICDMILVGTPIKQEGEIWLHTFKKSEGITVPALFNQGESCIVSTQDGRLVALAIGFVEMTEKDRITLMIDRDLSTNPELSHVSFTLDKGDIFSSGYNFSTLAKLMEDDPLSAKLRELLVDGRAPEFLHTVSKSTVGQVKSLFKRLNRPQKTAVLKVLMARDYVLIKGYPGTGKTSTIVSLVRILTSLGQTVLLTSYTHSAVDNILIKLREKCVDFVRLGRLERVHPQIKPYTAEALTVDITDVNKLEEFYDSQSVVAMTCYGVSHPVCSRRMFDVCIVDEASQIVLPACLGPLFCARKFVLVGDPQQLPPVIQSKEAVAMGMNDSLFVLLDSNKATYELNVQYRMNKSIMSLCNSLVYNQALQCASDDVADGRLQLIRPEVLEMLPEESSWQRSVLSPDQGVTFLDTSARPVPPDQDPTRNAAEAHVAQLLVQTLIQAGVAADDIGLIAPYRRQVELLKHVIGDLDLDPCVEVNTVDQYQGRDKAVIIITFTRCRPGDQAARDDILQDLRRLNVAITRAKHKLILIGSLRVLTNYSPLASLAQILTTQQIISLPAAVVV